MDSIICEINRFLDSRVKIRRAWRNVPGVNVILGKGTPSGCTPEDENEFALRERRGIEY